MMAAASRAWLLSSIDVSGWMTRWMRDLGYRSALHTRQVEGAPHRVYVTAVYCTGVRPVPQRYAHRTRDRVASYATRDFVESLCERLPDLTPAAFLQFRKQKATTDFITKMLVDAGMDEETAALRAHRAVMG